MAVEVSGKCKQPCNPRCNLTTAGAFAANKDGATCLLRAKGNVEAGSSSEEESPKG